MQVRVWNFDKRVNSTKQPIDEGSLITCTYKDASDLHNPVLILNTWMNSWNYAKIGDIYFFVNRCEAIANNLFHVYLSIDVLATYKADILNTKAVVLYSASNYNKNLIDSRFSASGNFNTISAEIPTNFNSEGIYTLTCSAAWSTNTTGFTTTYYITPHEMERLSFTFNTPDFWDKIKQWFENPFDAIVSVGWLPISINSVSNKVEKNIRIGDLQVMDGDTPVTGYIRTRETYVPSVYYNIGLRWTVDDFRKLTPFSRLMIYLPGCGLNEIPIEYFYNSNYIDIEQRLDVFTGSIEYLIYNKDGVVSQISGNVKTIIPIAQVQTRISNIVNFAAGVASTGALWASGHPFAAVTSGAYALANVLQPQAVKQNGALQGSFINGNSINNITVWLLTNECNDEPTNWRDVVGGVCNKTLLLSTLSGYIKTDSASVSADAYLSELNQINTMLNGGVYIE